MELPLLVKFLPQKALTILFKLQGERLFSLVCVDFIVPDGLVSKLDMKAHFFAIHFNQVCKAFIIADQ